MRLLIVDVNFDYKNTMYRAFYNNLASILEVDFFGPGYVNSDELAKGIEKFLEKKRNYDAIIVGCYFIYSSSQRDTGVLRYNAYSMHRGVLPYYKVSDAVKYCAHIMEEIITLPHPLKIINYYEDYVNMPIAEYRYFKDLMEHGFYMMCWGEEFMRQYDLKTIKKNPFLTNWVLELAKGYHQKYIPISYHGIQANELYFGDLSNRKYDWNVPGNTQGGFYSDRGDMKTFLTESGCNIWNHDCYQKLSATTIKKSLIHEYEFRNKKEKYLSFLEGKTPYISSHPKLTSIAACRENYLESLRHSKCVYADGATSKTIVRKYFEACANGAVLVCAEVPGLNNMGFIDGQNMIIADKNNILQIAKRLQGDSKSFQNIAEAGRKLVIAKHMFSNRIENLRESIEAIQKGIYAGAHWEKGDYCVECTDIK